ncbi:hypothetical protein DENSPDRAFT_771150 [Dentipellis sp. KUC8613]|nr:hypothetical protein DENSPDRAFT_771150 [Dentipellis sp. KUC8613]
MSFYSSPSAVPESDDPPIEFTPVPTTQAQSIARYLRSARLTTILKLTRSPHASHEHPLTVSLSDLGSPTGFPLVVFLGLGSVRYVMGLYDEMAEYLGIRLITIDRWGLGRTDTPKSKSARGIPEWSSVVEEVLDLLHIDQCSVMAHSAGAPYALSFANRVPERVRGEVLLLAPWVGGSEGAGYKWLKYVPTGILKTAQAAEWKIQAWMLGKPPTIAYEGIGYDATLPVSSPASRATSSHQRSDGRPSTSNGNGTHSSDSMPRPSVGSSVFSEYDDLRDFEGRFDSHSTLEANAGNSRNRSISESKPALGFKRKTSRNFLNRLKGNATPTQPQTPPTEKSPPSGPVRKLKALRSMGSLKGKSSSSMHSKKTSAPPPQVPDTLNLDIGLGFHALEWSGNGDSSSPSTPPGCDKDPFRAEGSIHGYNRRAGGRRSISFGAATRSSQPTMLSSPIGDSSSTTGVTATSSYQAALGNALIVASHAESSKGVHSDLLQILNHDQQPWGFSYVTYPHNVRVWYGDKDEKIAENAVRWMERNMGEDRCRVKVVKGADHGLMYRSSVVVEVLEQVRESWASGV